MLACRVLWVRARVGLGLLRPPGGVGVVGVEPEGPGVREGVGRRGPAPRDGRPDLRCVLILSLARTSVRGCEIIVFLVLARGRECLALRALNLHSYKGTITIHVFLTKKIARKTKSWARITNTELLPCIRHFMLYVRPWPSPRSVKLAPRGFVTLDAGTRRDFGDFPTATPRTRREGAREAPPAQPPRTDVPPPWSS